MGYRWVVLIVLREFKNNIKVILPTLDLRVCLTKVF